MQIESLKETLNKQTLASIYLVLGQESTLINEAKDLFKNYLSPDEATMNYASYDLETTSISQALDDAASAPFFGDRRIVLLQNPIFLTGEKSKAKVEHDLQAFIDYCQNPQLTTTLVVIAPYAKLDERKKITKALKNTATLVDVKKLTEQQIRPKVIAFLANQNLSIEPAAMTLLLNKTHGDYSKIMAELPKLCLQSYQDKIITSNTVKALISSSLEDDVFTIVPNVLNKKTTEAMRIYQELVLQKQDPIMINAILLSQFRLLIQVKILAQKGYAQGQLASTLKIHPYRIKLALQQIAKFDLDLLTTAYLGLVTIEQQLKTTQNDPQLLFELFMLKFGQ